MMQKDLEGTDPGKQRGLSRRSLMVWVGLLLIILAALLPSTIYEQMSSAPTPSLPISGVNLLRICLALEGTGLLIIHFLGISFASHPESRLILPEKEASTKLKGTSAGLFGILVLALLLRLYKINSDLWLDEITTVLNYQDLSLMQIITTYTGSNNHLLNTLAIKLMTNWWGISEWAIRLPAVIMGTVSVVAIYPLARIVLGRREALLTSLLLACSYHHIFFSQNARGYTGLILWSLLSTTFFLKGLTKDTTRNWLLYILCTFLSIATILHGLFVVAGHILSFLLVCYQLHQQKRPWQPLLKRLLAVWAILAVLVVNLYALIIPQVYTYIGTIYKSEAVGYAFFSREHWQEWQRSLAAGLGTNFGLLLLLILLSIPFVIAGLRFLYENSVYSLTLLSPLLVTCFLVMAWQLRVSPRMFIWALPIFFIFMVGSLGNISHAIITRWQLAKPFKLILSQSPLLASVALVILSTFALPYYYRTPKQPTQQSLAWLLEQKAPTDIIVAAYLSEWGLRFYGSRRGIKEGESFFVARSQDSLGQIERQHAHGTIWLLMTFPRALRLEQPDLYQYILNNYRLLQTFPATVGDAEISVWQRQR